MQKLTPPASLWRATATPPATAPQALADDIRADVAIIGGGYTGLSAALRAIERGLKPVILEAGEVGFGASGRNGGVVSTKYRVSLSDMAKRHGVEIARRMNALGHEAMDRVETCIDEFQLDQAGFRKTGNLRCAHNAVALRGLVAEVEAARTLLGDQSLRTMNAEEVAFETGTNAFAGGVLNTHAGVIHPLNYARGLAGAVTAGGGAIYENSPVLTWARHGADKVFQAGHGSVTARRCVIATNAYSDMTGATAAVRRTVIPFRSAIVATEPLPAGILDTILRNGRSYSETRRMMRWFRQFDDRIVFGGRGAFGKTDSEAAFQALEQAMAGIFPALAGRRVTHRWSGLVAMSLDSLPQIGLIEDGAAFSVGYNGTGIAMSTLLGRYALDLAMGDRCDLGLMYRERPEAIPLFFLREPTVRAVAGWYQFLDRIGR